MIQKNDGESPIVALREARARKHGGIMSPEQPPKGEHASNGVVEEAGKTIRDMCKVLKLQLETRLGRTLHMKESIMHWLERWSAMAFSRFQVCKATTASTRTPGQHHASLGLRSSGVKGSSVEAQAETMQDHRISHTLTSYAM